MRWPLLRNKTRTVICPDKSVILVFKNPDDAFPLYVKEWAAAYTTAIKAFGTVEATVSLALKQQVAGFFFQLDEANRNTQLSLRQIYAIYMGEPCRLRNWLRRETERIIHNEAIMRRNRLAGRVTTLLSNNVDERTIVQELATAQREALEIDTGDDELRTAFQEAEKDVTVWRHTS